jgi:hypothetical protein
MSNVMDSMYNVKWAMLKRVCMVFLTAIDKPQYASKPGETVASVAIILLGLCRRFKLDIRRVLETAERIERFAHEGKYVGHKELNAMDEYMKYELED